MKLWSTDMSGCGVVDDPTNPTIARNYRLSDWKELNISVPSPEADWQKAVSIFHDRNNSRFLVQIRTLEK
jgi:hypothetical protein